MRVLKLSNDAIVLHRIIDDSVEQASEIAGKAIVNGFDIESHEFDWEDILNDAAVASAAWDAVMSGLPFEAPEDEDMNVPEDEDMNVPEDEDIDVPVNDIAQEVIES